MQSDSSSGRRNSSLALGGAILLGTLTACGFQPLALWPLTLVAIAGLIELCTRAATARVAFLTGWMFGLGHFTAGNYWIATAFTYQAQMPPWLGNIAVVLLALYLAVFPALAAMGAWLFASRARELENSPELGPLPLFGPALIPLWIVTEWMRAWMFTGFAWNPLGVSLLGPYDAQGVALTAKWIGTYGLSGLAIAMGAILRRLVLLIRIANAVQRFALAAGTATMAVFLYALMHGPANYLLREEGARAFTLVQPDIRQEALDDPRLYEANFWKLANLTVRETPRRRRLVLWPESGVPDYLRDGYPGYLYRQMTYAADPVAARKRIGQVIGPESLLLTGAVDIVVEDGEDVAARNSITAIDSHGHILAGYSKAHLVPYGEYLPMRWLLEPLGASRLVAGTLDFWPGPGPRTYDLGLWGKAGMQICYEIVFSGQVVDPRIRPDYIFNPSNDGWFGAWGPPQHLAQARLRAIEEGIPVLRATTTGISAVIDANGIVRQHVARHQAGRIDGRIPPAHEPTLFARYGNAIPIVLALFLLALCEVAISRSSR